MDAAAKRYPDADVCRPLPVGMSPSPGMPDVLDEPWSFIPES
jgi:hypothetical protein